MKTLTVICIIAFAGCEYELPPHHRYPTMGIGMSNEYAAIVKDYEPDSAECVDLINYVASHYQIYDSLYVIKLPKDAEEKQVYTVVPLEGEKIIFWFHFFSIRNNNQLPIAWNYDPQGIEIFEYLEQRNYFIR